MRKKVLNKRTHKVIEEFVQLSRNVHDSQSGGSRIKLDPNNSDVRFYLLFPQSMH